MTGLVDWAARRARMILAFIVLSILAGATAYISLPKEGEPDIDYPALFVSVPFPGISAEDSEKLLVKVMETELSDLDGLEDLSSTAAESYAGVAMIFEFGWDKQKTLADVRDAMNAAEAKFPEGAEKYTINEVNFSEFPIIVVNLSGEVPERTMIRLAEDLQDDLEGLEPILEAGITGNREEMVEVEIDPLRLEAYNITAVELINVIRNNNQLIAAGELHSASGAFSVKIPSSFDQAEDIYDLPIKTQGDRVVTLGDLARISLTFEDRVGTARFNGHRSIALQVVKRKGFNIIDTAELVRETVNASTARWPERLQAAVHVSTSNDQSDTVESMVRQLEGAVLTAIALVMIVTLTALGIRSALLVGFAIPTSFLLCFALLAVMGVTISTIVMFGLILAVGMLVDGAIVVVEYADKRIDQGVGPMHAYVDAAKRMFWPVVSSTATTLCAFLPMLFWPGVAGEFMGMLPVTLIFVLSASLLVALVYLPVVGGITGRLERWLNGKAEQLARGFWLWHAVLFPLAIGAVILASRAAPRLGKGLSGILANMEWGHIFTSVIPALILAFLLVLLIMVLVAIGLAGLMAILIATMGLLCRMRRGWRWLMARSFPERARRIDGSYHRSPFGYFIHAIVGNPLAPLLACGVVFVFVGSVVVFYIGNNNGSDFFVESEPENAIIYVRGRGNLSIEQKDRLVAQVERIALDHPNVGNVFAFAGDSGLNNNTGGAQPPKDTIGQVQIELLKWEDRPTIRDTWFTIPLIGYEVQREITAPSADGDVTLRQLTSQLGHIPGIKIEILALERGPASEKPVHLRIRGDNWDSLLAFTLKAREKFEQTRGLELIEDTLPLPGIDWKIDVDVEDAGRFGVDVSTVGAMVQLVTRGIIPDTMRVPSSDEEIDIRVRLPKDDRVLSTLHNLKIPTQNGAIPLSNFITVTPAPKLAQINRFNQSRYFDVKAAVTPGLTSAHSADGRAGTVPITVPITANERIATLTEWLESGVLPPDLQYEWTGDAEDQAESQAFLKQAFAGALGLMFIILLAQFNSLYNSVLVLTAVVLSTTGVLIGMLVMNQPFSVIMTGTGIVALAGIVVNNNIVLIDTYQEYSRYMPGTEAITRTAEARIRPVLLTTITTMAGLAPMVLGLSLDFFNGGYSFNSPSAMWWKQLSTAVVFGLGIATLLTLVVTPALLALRIWVVTYIEWLAWGLAKISLGSGSRAAQDWALSLAARRAHAPEILWENVPLRE